MKLEKIKLELTISKRKNEDKEKEKEKEKTENQRWLGHSRLDTTASIYTHVTEEFFFSESKKFKLI